MQHASRYAYIKLYPHRLKATLALHSICELISSSVFFTRTIVVSHSYCLFHRTFWPDLSTAPAFSDKMLIECISLMMMMCSVMSD